MGKSSKFIELIISPLTKTQTFPLHFLFLLFFFFLLFLLLFLQFLHLELPTLLTLTRIRLFFCNWFVLLLLAGFMIPPPAPPPRNAQCNYYGSISARVSQGIKVSPNIATGSAKAFGLAEATGSAFGSAMANGSGSGYNLRQWKENKKKLKSNKEKFRFFSYTSGLANAIGSASTAYIRKIKFEVSFERKKTQKKLSIQPKLRK